jgi:hypothetical protein
MFGESFHIPKKALFILFQVRELNYCYYYYYHYSYYYYCYIYMWNYYNLPRILQMNGRVLHISIDAAITGIVFFYVRLVDSLESSSYVVKPDFETITKPYVLLNVFMVWLWFIWFSFAIC